MNETKPRTEYANGAYLCACGYMFLKDGDRWTCSTGRVFSDGEAVEDHAPFTRLVPALDREVLARIIHETLGPQTILDLMRRDGKRSWDEIKGSGRMGDIDDMLKSLAKADAILEAQEVN